MEKPPFFALHDGAHRFSKDGEFFAVPRGNPRKEREYVDCKAFSVFYVFHNHERVEKPSVFTVACQIDNVYLMCNLWERFFPVATL